MTTGGSSGKERGIKLGGLNSLGEDSRLATPNLKSIAFCVSKEVKGRFLVRYPTALVGGVCTRAETEAKAAKLLQLRIGH